MVLRERGQTMGGLRYQKKILLFIIPALFLYILFFIYPFFQTVFYSFTNWDGFTGASLVGVKNFGQILGDVAELQCETLSRISFSFDKSRADFENGAAYRAARRRYNAAAFARLRTDFTEGVNKVLKELNAAIPAEVREANKQ